MVFGTLSSAICLCVFYFYSQMRWMCFYVDWTASVASSFLGLAVAYEIFCLTLKPFRGLKDGAKVLFRWAALVTVLVVGFTGFTALLSSVDAEAFRLANSLLNVDLSLQVMECGLLLLVYVAGYCLGLSPRGKSFGLALGFGILAVCNLVVVTAATRLHDSVPLNLANGIVSIVIAALWTVYFALPEPEPKPIRLPVTSPLIRWNEAAMMLDHIGEQTAAAAGAPVLPQIEHRSAAKDDPREHRIAGELGV